MRWNGKGYNPLKITVYELKNGCGLIKEYFTNGRLKFKGEYINGKRYGNGKEYDEYGRLLFQGEYINGERY